MKRLLLILCAMLMGMSSLWAYDFSAVNSDGKWLYYNITDSTNHEVEVAQYPDTNSKYSGAINIPASVVNNGTTYSVTGIGGGFDYSAHTCLGAFYGCSGLTSVTIPNSVTTIGEFAFYCSGLTSVMIPNSVTTIGGGAFEGCSGLTSVTIPNSVTTIGVCAFNGCSGLTSVTLGNSVNTIGDGAFGYTAITNITIPNSVTYLSGFNNTNLTSVTIPNSVTTIGEFAFYCSGLTSVTIPNSVTTIGESAFAGCSGLTSVTIPNSVTTIGEEAFAGCSGLTSVTIPNSVTTIGEEAFRGCSGLTSVTIPNSVTTIGEEAFRGCSGLTSVTLPNRLDTIKGGTFCGCSGLTSIVIPNSVRAIVNPGYWVDGAFAACSGLTSVTIGNSVTTIGGDAFYGCSGLTSVVIPNSVTTIEWSAFEDCSGLTSVTIGNSVTTIAGWAFADDSNLHTIYWNAKNVIDYSDTDENNNYYHPFVNSPVETVIFGDSVQTIPSKAFKNFTTLDSLVIGNSVTTIGGYAFRGCSGLTSVTIPNSVTTIGGSAFRGCSGLTSVTLPNRLDTIKGGTFYGCRGLTSIVIPNSVRAIGNPGDWGAFAACSGLTSVTIGNSVTRIAGWAFADDSNLHTIYWNAQNVTDYGYTDEYYGTYYHPFVNSPIETVVFGDSVQTIPSKAFENFTTLDSLVIGNSVTTIGNSAFNGCNRIQQIRVNAITPPSLGNYAFQNVRSTIPVYVPCEALSTYQNNFDWNYFTNIQCGTVVYSITATSGNSAWGTVTGGGDYEQDAIAVLTATANEGYRFMNWTDGNTENPRSVVVTSDSMFIAMFEAIPTTEHYTITVMSSNDNFGTVTGGGEYEEGTTATLMATANEGYHFVSWNDGNTENPRTITVTADATYIATFAEDEPEGIEDVEELAGVRVYPNPTSGMICVEGDEVDRVEVLDLLGVKVKDVENCSKVDLSGLESGVYVLRIFVGDEVAVRRVVKR